MIFEKLFGIALKNRSQIIIGFKIIYFVLIAVLFIGGREIYYQDKNFAFYYFLAVKAGKLSLIFYLITTIPGIARRFGIRNPLIQTIMIFRRYFGITMYLLILIHFWFIRGIELIFIQNKLLLNQPLFEISGLIAYILLFFMFVTANDFSVGRLRKWWQRIQNLTYIIVWFIFLHLALQRVGIWSIMAGTGAILQISSHVFYFFKKATISELGKST